MVATCSNPACNRKFEQLSKGRLYLLPPTQDAFGWAGGGKLSDYCYWLCPECDATHTLTRCGSEQAVTNESLAFHRHTPLHFAEKDLAV